jgi:MATE family multidrug resistance protein
MTAGVSEAVVTRPSAGQLLGLAWPIVVQRSAQVVIGASDALMVARLGETAFGAASAGGHNAFALFILPMGTVFIVSSFSSQLFGKGDLAGARRYAFYGLGVALLTQLLCMLAIPFIPAALGTMSYPPEITTLMAEYLAIRLLGGGAVVGLEALGNYYGGLNNVRLPMLAQLFAMVLDVGLNWVMIFGKLGFPAMGVRGAAWSSTIATTIVFFGLYACFHFGVGVPEGGRRRTPLKMQEMRALLRFGLPSGLNWFIEFAAFIFFLNVIVASLGKSELAAMLAVLQINSVSFMPAFGLATAGAIFVGQAIGAGKKDDVPRTVRLTMITCAVWEGAVGLCYLAIPAVLLAPFVEGEGAAFMAAGVVMLRLSASWQLFDAALNTLAEALRAAGDTKFTAIARGAIAWLFFFPGAWISVHVLGGREVVATAWLVVYLAVLAGVLWWRFRSGRWRELELTEDVVLEAVPSRAG